MMACWESVMQDSKVEVSSSATKNNVSTLTRETARGQRKAMAFKLTSQIGRHEPQLQHASSHLLFIATLFSHNHISSARFHPTILQTASFHSLRCLHGQTSTTLEEHTDGLGLLEDAPSRQ